MESYGLDLRSIKLRVTIRPDLGGTVPLLEALSRCPAFTMKSPAFALFPFLHQI